MKVTFKLMTLAFLLPFSFNLHSTIPPEPPQMLELKKAWKQAKELYRNQPWIVIEQWDKYRDNLDALPADVQFNWHRFAVSAYMREGHYHNVAAELGDLLAKEQALEPQNIVTLANLAGVFFSFIGKPTLAASAYQCALKQKPSGPIINARLHNNLALAQIREQSYKAASKHFERAIAIAKQQNDMHKEAMYSTNLGYALLLDKKPEQALTLFKRSLFLKEKHSGSGTKVKTALYLLHTLAMLEDWVLYDRYYESIERIVKTHPKFWVDNYFTWVTALAHARRTGIKPNDEQKQLLVDELSDETDLQTLNVDYRMMAEQLGIQLPYYQPLREAYGDIDDGRVARFIDECVGK